MKIKARTWSVSQAHECLRDACKAKGYVVLREMHQNVPATRAKWRQSYERALAVCEQENIDPVNYFASVAESMGWFCSNKSIMLSPSMLVGPGAMKRYNNWLTRSRKKTFRTDTVKHKRDKRLDAEMLFVEIYCATYSVDPTSADSVAKSAVKKVHKKYRPDRRRRVIALREFVGRLHPTMPDRLVLRRDWKTSDVMRALCDTLELWA